MTEARKLRVFLCHASQDKTIVRELYQRLLAEGWIDPWLDEEKLLPGQDWDLEIEKAVESSDAVVVCISSISVVKEGYLQKELRQVLKIALETLEGSTFILPVRLDDCEVPRQLREKQFVDYFPVSSRQAAFDKLKLSLRLRSDFLEILNRPNLDRFNLSESLAITEYVGLILAVISAMVAAIMAPLSWDLFQLMAAAFVTNMFLILCAYIAQTLVMRRGAWSLRNRFGITNVWLISLIWILPLPTYYALVFSLLRGG